MNSLTLPDFDYTALDRADLAPGTLRHYKAAIALLIASNINIMDYAELANYAHSLPHSGRSNLKAALKIVTRDYVNRAKTSSAPVETIQRFLWAMEAMNDAIVISKPTTERTPHWLSQAQVDRLTSMALATSSREYIVLAVLLGAGVRCEELATLTFDAVSQIPMGTQMVDILTIRGKGDKKRVIRISALLASHLREWKLKAGSGRIARRIYKGGRLGDSLSVRGIFDLVRRYGQLIGIPDLDPHDCRRSYGRLMYQATGDIVLVKDYLGHADTKTTLRYIGEDLNLDVPEDAFPVRATEFVMQVAGD